jgi:hypothetical protein
MPLYEGIVAKLKADGKAEVMIRPGKPGIPGAPELTGKICHCATRGSTVRTEALNWVDADVGDWVVVSRRAGALMKNAAALLGSPVIGACIGLVTGEILFAGVAFWLTAMVVSALLGLIMGVTIYRRISVYDQPVIRRIIRTRKDMACGAHSETSWTQGRATSVGESMNTGPSSIPTCSSQRESNCILFQRSKKIGVGS